jgi:hypothetical protein
LPLRVLPCAAGGHGHRLIDRPLPVQNAHSLSVAVAGHGRRFGVDAGGQQIGNLVEQAMQLLRRLAS